MPGPLQGVRVLEFTQIIAGPFGGMLLGDQGADVIKVEPPGGEPWRLFAQFMPLESKAFQALNRSKRSLTLDLATSEARAIVQRLVASMDIVICNYRPDVPARLGIDYATLRACKPDLIYIDATAFGRRGPWAQKPGYDIIAQGVAGLTAAAGRFDERGTPLLPGGTATADFATGYAIAWGACAALYHRAQTGEGQLVETSLLINALNFLGGSVMSLPPADTMGRAAFLHDIAEARARGEGYAAIVQAHQRRLAALQVGNIYYRNYLTQDGAIAVGCLSASLRQKLRDVLGIDYDPRDHDPNYDPRDPETIAAGNALRARVETMIAAKPTGHWLKVFEAGGVPVGELQFAEELDQHPQIIENEYVVALEHDLSGPQTMVAPPHKMSATPPAPRSASPPLGRDSEAILAEFGYDEATIAALRAGGVIR
jgi:crotonobetainyl-CoA:carnitine CoA-transferase CaiB-like acyl-CoA transferase